MKTLSAGLSDQAPVLVYDKTKPYLAGRTYSKTLSGTPVYGPPMTGFINTQLDTGAAPQALYTSPNGRQFQVLTITSGIAIIALYNIDITGQTAPAYVGRIFVRVPNNAATTHTLKGFHVWDGANSGVVTGWQIYIGTTGSVLINGGMFIANKIALADFSPLSPPTIEMAVTSDAKAVYMVQDTATQGVANTLTAMQGMALDRTTRRVYFHNNVLATTQFAVVDPSVTQNVNVQTASSANVNAGVTTFNFTGHGYANNDPVVLIGTVPTGFTASTQVAVQTVYYVRNSTANTFELSLTSGGASILGTSVVSGTQAARAFGQSTSSWLGIRTGTVTGFTGIFLLTNCEDIVTPSQALDPSIPAAVDGQTCLFLSTTTNVYLVKVSEITNGATTFPTMVTVNVLGTATDYTAITAVYAIYSETTGRVVVVSNVSQFYVKRWVSGSIQQEFGGLDTTYLENIINTPYTFAGVTASSLEARSGFLFFTLTAIGQRGILYMDFRSDNSFNYSFITSEVKDTSDIAFAKTIQTVEALFDLTSTMQFSYKTAATYADTIFDDPTTGWSSIEQASDLSAIALNNYTQFRIGFDIALGNINTPSQINELFMSYIGKGEISDYWTGSVDNTSLSASSPMYVAFRLKTAYASSVPTMYLRGYDDSGSLVYNFNTVTDAAIFEYTTNNGTSWTAFGTPPNTALTTEVRALISSPNGNRVTWSWMES